MSNNKNSSTSISALYKLKDPAVIKSPPSLKKLKSIYDSNNSNTEDNHHISNLNDEEMKIIEDRFNLTYRATTSPSLIIFQKNALQNRMQLEDSGIVKPLLTNRAYSKPKFQPSHSPIDLNHMHRQLLSNTISAVNDRHYPINEISSPSVIHQDSHPQIEAEDEQPQYHKQSHKDIQSPASLKNNNISISNNSTEKESKISRTSSTKKPRSSGSFDSLLALLSPSPKKLQKESLNDQIHSHNGANNQTAKSRLKRKVQLDSSDDESISAIEQDNKKVTSRGRSMVPPVRYVTDIADLPKASNNKVENSKRGRGRPPKNSIIESHDNEVEESTIVKSKQTNHWLPQEFTALYTAYGRTEVTAPDFWSQVSLQLAKIGIQKTEKECHDRWFLSLQETEARRQKNKSKVATSSLESSNKEINDDQINENNPKSKHLGKAAIKRLAEKSSLAIKEDDLFDMDPKKSKSMQLTTKSTDRNLSQKAFQGLRSPDDSSIESSDAESSVNDEFSLKRKPKNTFTRAEIGKVSYVDNLKKKVASLKNPNPLVGNVNKAKSKVSFNSSKRKEKVVSGLVSGMFSPKTGKLHVHIERDEEEEELDDSDNEIDSYDTV